MHSRAGRTVSNQHARLCRAVAVAVCAVIAGCGNALDEDSSANAGAGSIPLGGRDLRVIAADPTHQAVQVAVDAPVVVDFDGPIAPECLESGLTGLFVADTGERVDATVEIGEAGHRVVFRPDAPLARETDFELRLDPLTCDFDGRVLDETVEVWFRTIDLTPPSIVAWSHDGSPRPVSVDQPIVLHASEALDPQSVDAGSVTFRDAEGRAIAVDLALEGNRIVLRPVRDLAGSFDFVVAVRGLRDRSGNRAADSWSRRAATAPDHDPPELVSSWPPAAWEMSPLVTPTLKFDESIVLPPGLSSVEWHVDGLRDPIPFGLVASRDGRTLWLVPHEPLTPGSRCTIGFGGAGTPLHDADGNSSKPTTTPTFRIGSDLRRPAVRETSPGDGTDRVPVYALPEVWFDEPIDPSSIEVDTITLLPAGGTAVALEPVEIQPGGMALRAATREPLRPDTAYQLRIRGGLGGVRDLAGNTLVDDVVASFRTNADSLEPTLRFWPAPSSGDIPTDASLVAAASQALDPATVQPGNVRVVRADGSEVDGDLVLEPGARVFRFTPRQDWERGVAYLLHARGGEDGIRAANGNWLRQDAVLPFRTGFRTDTISPRIAVTLEGIGAPRSDNRAAAPAGIALEVRPVEGYDPTFDPTTVELEVDAGGRRSTAAELASEVEFVRGAFRVRITADRPLPQGPVTARATARDLSGNRSALAQLEFVVVPADAESLPFERTQVVWVRFDLDRSGNGRPDFEDDLMKLGLCAATDPLGRNDRMIAVVRDGVLAQCRQLFHRRPTGGPSGPDSVPLRVTHRQPHGIVYTEIACGGFDPEGTPGRAFPAPSTGVLGRAWFDHRNAHTNEKNTSVQPGLGVFPAELWLFEARVHSQVYPSLMTTFARNYLGLAPELGGIPAGTGPVDAAVLDPGFDPHSAPSVQLARWQAVFSAADDWSTAIGTILAHEIGHTVGLTAPGISRTGLHGDASLHNIGATPTDVMAAAIGFDALVSLEFGFRDLNLAYLRQRIVLR